MRRGRRPSDERGDGSLALLVGPQVQGAGLPARAEDVGLPAVALRCGHGADHVREDLCRRGDGPVAYRDVLVSHEHGELGPVLAVKGRPFQGPNDLH